MKSENGCVYILMKLVMILFTLIVGYLLISSIFSTAYIGEMEYPTLSGIRERTTEHTYFVRDYWWLHILIFVGISFIMYLTDKRRELSQKQIRYIYLAAIFLYILISSIIVIVGNVAPRFDQKHCMDIANQMRNGNYKEIQPGGYLFKCPHQVGIVIAIEILSNIFGDGNFIILQILNTVLSAIIFAILNRNQKQGIVLSILFLPWVLTNTLVYGTIPGLALCIISFYLVNHKRSHNMGYLCMCLAGILVAISVVLKPNYMIFAISILIYLLLGLFNKERKPVSVLLFVIVFSISHICLSQISENYLNSLSGGEVTGVPMSGYIAMGLQDGKLAPGWYNGYHLRVYNEDYDYEKSDAEFKTNIVNTFKNDLNDPSTGISRFSKKIQSEWNNPTFQSVWLVEEGNLKAITEGRGRYIYINYCNILQTIILTFTFIFCITRIRDCKVCEILFPIFFIGGFLFHLIWEAQCIYTTPYFICLIPMAILGMLEWKKAIKKVTAQKIICAVAICTIVCVASFLDPFQKLIARCDDTQYYDTYNQPMYMEEQIANEK